MPEIKEYGKQNLYEGRGLVQVKKRGEVEMERDPDQQLSILDKFRELFSLVCQYGSMRPVGYDGREVCINSYLKR